MSQKRYGKAKPGSALAHIGLWATIWWGLSCFYLVLLVWLSKNTYADNSVGNPAAGILHNWGSAIKYAYQTSSVLPLLLYLILAGWIIGGLIWLKALKRQKISYKVALKDLFLNLRK